VEGRHPLTTAFAVVTAVFVVGSLLQVFLAGLGIFGAESFEPHETVGGIVHALAIVGFLLALASPARKRDAPLALLLALLVTGQILLVDTRDDAPGLAALHPLLGVLDLGLGAWLAWRAWAPRRVMRPA
jgi:hypothetical protein